MTLKMTFSKGKASVTLPSLPADFASEFTSLSPRMLYLAEMGWKQSLSDSYAGAEENEFAGVIQKKFDAIIAGAVRVGGGGARVTDPVEREFKRLLSIATADWVKERKGSNKPKPSAELTEIWVNRYVEVHGEELRATATANVERQSALPTSSLDDLLEGLE